MFEVKYNTEPFGYAASFDVQAGYTSVILCSVVPEEGIAERIANDLKEFMITIYEFGIDFLPSQKIKYMIAEVIESSIDKCIQEGIASAETIIPETVVMLLWDAKGKIYYFNMGAASLWEKSGNDFKLLSPIIDHPKCLYEPYLSPVISGGIVGKYQCDSTEIIIMMNQNPATERVESMENCIRIRDIKIRTNSHLDNVTMESMNQKEGGESS